MEWVVVLVIFAVFGVALPVLLHFEAKRHEAIISESDRKQLEKIKKAGLPSASLEECLFFLVEKNAELERRVEDLEKVYMTPEYYNESE